MQQSKIPQNMKYDAMKQKNLTQNKCNEAVLWPQPANASFKLV